MSWETVIGLEVHAELSTQSKIFCGCATDFGGEPNTHVCPVCAGMPGSLPKLNRSVLEYALRLALTLDCTIKQNCKFDRKNYFYPDLPKAYQVSQLYQPIGRDGKLDIETDGHTKTIGISDIHIEEDAGKLIHDLRSGGTFMDYNRCGVPLLEIVSQPDFRSGAEVLAYLEKLREILLYLDICDGKMQEGSMRADVNLSVRPVGGAMGTRTEMKNLNSLKAIGRAIAYETQRQIEILESGGPVVQETRRWDDDKGESYGMRSKENAQDYRYFPEPDLLPVQVDEGWLRRVRDSLPELAHQKRARYSLAYGISKQDAAILTRDKSISNLFEAVAALSGQPAEAASLITGEVMRLLHKTKTPPEDLKLDAHKLAQLIAWVTEGRLNRTAYKETVEAVFLEDVEPEAYIAQKGLEMVSDDAAVAAAVQSALAENPDAVADYAAGKQKAFGFLMGQAMKKLKGAGNPEAIKAMMTQALQAGAYGLP